MEPYLLIVNNNHKIRAWLLLLVLLGPTASAANSVDRLFGSQLVPPAVSPDGERLALLGPEGRLLLADTSAPLRRRENQRIDGRPLRLSWFDHTRLLIESREGAQQRWHLYDTEARSKRELIAWSTERGLGVRMLLAQPSRDRVLLSYDRDVAWVPNVFALRLDGELRQLLTNPGDVARWIVDGAGRLRLAQAWQLVDEQPVYQLRYRSGRRPFAGGRWTTVASNRLSETEAKPLGFAGNGGVVIGRENGLSIWQPRSGQERPLLAGYELTQPSALQWGNQGVALVKMDGLLPQQLVIDPRWRQRLSRLNASVPGLNQHLLGRGGHFSLWLASSDTEPGVALLHNERSGEITEVSRLLPEVDRRQLSSTTSFRTTAPDGLELSGYLTLPQLAAPTTPVIVLVHGGPWARDYWGFNAEVQYLASLGFAVLQVNFRGSRGLGHELLFAGYRQWGRKMQDDLNVAVDWAVSTHQLDANKVCLMGASYGGYAALTGVLRDSHRYRCAVAFAPVTDLADQLSVLHEIGNTRGYQEWRFMVGDPQELTELSPLAHAGRLSRPVLIAHGQNDQTVPIRHSERFAVAATPQLTELVRLAGVGHSLPSTAQQRHWYQRVGEFLQGHLQ